MNVGFLKQLGDEYRIQGNSVIHERTKTFCRIIKPNRDILYIVGFLADGCLSKRKWKYETEIYQKNKKLLEKIAKMFEKNFKIKPKISWHKDVYRMRVCSKPLFIYLEEILNKVHKNLDKMNFKKYFVSGFVDAEGSLIKLKNGLLRVAITQSENVVLQDIQKVLEECKIHSKIYGPYKHGNSKKQMYYLHIEGKHAEEFLKKFKSLRFKI